MSKCKNCKSSTQCSKVEPEEFYTDRKSHKKDIFTDFLDKKSDKKIQKKPKPLSHFCEHNTYDYVVYGHQCIHCIKQWVYSVGAKKAQEHLKKTDYGTIATGRILDVIEMYKREHPDFSL